MTLIAHITDLHLRPRGLPCYRVSDTNMLAERAMAALRALQPRPDAVVITGDLTDRSDPREYAVARNLLARLDLPVFIVPGNHDSTDDMRREMDAFLGPVNANTGKICYSTDIGDIRLVALDTHMPGKPTGEIGKDQLLWLQKELSAHPKPTLIALHHPPALSGIAHMDAIGLIDAPALAEVIQPHAHVERLLCGHLHRPIISGFAGKIMTLAPSTCHQVVLDLTENGPAHFNFEPAAFFLHRYTQETGTVTHTAYVESYPGPYDFFSDPGVTWPGDDAT
ncbi:phosphodiesterase [Roseibium denhamense]|uniref:3',5'-cyclic AMP phosphodiesterase CpdA n=1 Tax=Roseibium denhamense TaxID=76305 RepID=A0ABY1NQU0_9HYPH|nr:phosphodiesterase [Roseibium denhamense]MTI08001.1 phosphodiesterase [Roseibium denhamense]SMP15573.1 3',5'-cyclic AMP phosphodiesterase CpdA [Roseibium denhamense]